MRARIALVAILFVIAAVVPAFAQQTGGIRGRVTDNTGAVLPGVTVTLGSEAGAPQSAVTTETGTYLFASLPNGVYTLTFELAGFQTILREGIRLNLGQTLDINQVLEISSVEETITVTGETPVVDTTETGTSATFNREMLQTLPSARDPWVILEQTPGITMDRANVGGSQSGQQSGYISRGDGSGNNKWTIDGVDITDMSATGASPIYYDFDMLEEMQIVTGGVDASQQTGGVGINMVTRSGTDRFRGSGRFYYTDDKFEADNITDELKLAGAGSGAPIQNIKDFGFEVGGPIMKGKMWYWGSYGKQDIKAGIVGFYLPSAECQAIKQALKADPLANIPTGDVRACLGTDGTQLTNYNWKFSWAVTRSNKFSFQNTWAEKFKNARNAADNRPIETTYRQRAVANTQNQTFGTWGWDIGPSPLWKAGDQHIFSDRLLLDVQWAHLGNNFILDYHEDSLRDVQRIYNIDTGIYERSYGSSGPYIRPTHSLDVTLNYFLPGTLGGDHAFKAGYRWRTAPAHSESSVGGQTEARFRNGVASEATLYRQSITEYDLRTWSIYLQDTFTRNRLTLKLGFRFDHQEDEALPSSVPAHPFAAQWLPAISFDGATPGASYSDFSPRLGFTYDLTGEGKTIINGSWALYYGQMSPGELSGTLNPVSTASIRFPWTDLNGDRSVQANELDYTRILTYGGNYDPDNPTALSTTGTVDPNIRNDRTQEFIVGFDHELFPGFGVGGSYIWRKYDQYRWSDRVDFSSADYVQRTYTPTCAKPDARCETITYWEPTKPIPAAYVYRNQPDRYRNFNGFELTARKRYADNWMLSSSFSYNSAVDHWDSPNAYEDPSNIENLNGGQFAPQSGGSGIDNIFTNAKWLFKVSGLYTLPYEINLSAFFNSRQGYPAPLYIQSPTRANRAGRASIYLDRLGDNRLPNFWTVDFKVEKAFSFGQVRFIPSMDVFNVTNSNVVLAVRRLQTASNANNVSAIIAPRVIRFGARVTW